MFLFDKIARLTWLFIQFVGASADLIQFGLVSNLPVTIRPNMPPNGARMARGGALYMVTRTKSHNGVKRRELSTCPGLCFYSEFDNNTFNHIVPKLLLQAFRSVWL